MTDRTTKILRWSARAAGMLVAATILLFYIGEGGFAAARATTSERILMLLFIASWLGLLVGWHWELAGGLMNVVGMALFYAAHWIASGRFPRGMAFVAIATPGVAYLICAWRDAHRRRVAQPPRVDATAS